MASLPVNSFYFAVEIRYVENSTLSYRKYVTWVECPHQSLSKILKKKKRKKNTETLQKFRKKIRSIEFDRF